MVPMEWEKQGAHRVQNLRYVAFSASARRENEKFVIVAPRGLGGYRQLHFQKERNGERNFLGVEPFLWFRTAVGSANST